MAETAAVPRPCSEADLLTISEAVERIGIRESAGIAWLRERRLVRAVSIAGRQVERVIWGDVLRAWAQALPPEPAAAPSGIRLVWADLDEKPRRKDGRP